MMSSAKYELGRLRTLSNFEHAAGTKGMGSRITLVCCAEFEPSSKDEKTVKNLLAITGEK